MIEYEAGRYERNTIAYFLNMRYPYDYLEPTPAFCIALLHYYMSKRDYFLPKTISFSFESGAVGLTKQILETAPQPRLISYFINDGQSPSLLLYPYLYNKGNGLPNYYYRYLNFIFKVYMYALDIVPFHCLKPTAFKSKVEEINDLYMWTISRKRRWFRNFMYNYYPMKLYWKCYRRGQIVLDPLFIMEHLFTFPEFLKTADIVIPTIEYIPKVYHLAEDSKSMKKLSKFKSLHLIHIKRRASLIQRQYHHSIQRRIKLENIRIMDPLKFRRYE